MTRRRICRHNQPRVITLSPAAATDGIGAAKLVLGLSGRVVFASECYSWKTTRVALDQQGKRILRWGNYCSALSGCSSTSSTKKKRCSLWINLRSILAVSRFVRLLSASFFWALPLSARPLSQTGLPQTIKSSRQSSDGRDSHPSKVALFLAFCMGT